MRTLVHYDHLRREIIIQKLDDREDPERHLRGGEPGDKKADPDPYWHVVDGDWTVVDCTEHVES